MKNLKEAGNLVLALIAIAIVTLVAGHYGLSHGLMLATAFIGWVDASVGALPQQRGEPGLAAGGHLFGFAQSWAKKTTDGNGTIYFVTELPSDAIIWDLKLYNDALTGATSADIGIFELDRSLSNLGTVDQTAADYYAGSPTTGTPSVATPKVDAGNIFMAATDISAGSAEGSSRDALANLVVQTITSLGATTFGFLNYGVKLWQLLGFTDPKWKSESYALGLRLNTAGAAAGNLALRGLYIAG